MKNKLFSYGALAVIVVIVGFATAVAQTGVLFVTDNKVGIGTSTPEAPLHIQTQVGEPNIRLETLASADLFRTVAMTAGRIIGSLSASIVPWNAGERLPQRTRSVGKGKP